jgi:hypothetical protein
MPLNEMKELKLENKVVTSLTVQMKDKVRLFVFVCLCLFFWFQNIVCYKCKVFHQIKHANTQT